MSSSVWDKLCHYDFRLARTRAVDGYEIAIRAGPETIDRQTIDALKEIVEERKLGFEKKENSMFIFQEKHKTEQEKTTSEQTT